MKKIINFSSKICGFIVVILGFSATTSSCKYGMPPMGYDIKLSGTVKSKTTNLPIKGIKVSRPNSSTYEITDENGEFSFDTFIFDRFDKYTNYRSDSIPILFTDIDGIENGYFADKEVIIDPAHKDEIKINVKLENK